MSLHPKVDEAFDEIDAAVFSGDSFHDPDNLAELERYIARWSREIAVIRKERIEAQNPAPPCPECGSTDCNGECMECP